MDQLVVYGDFNCPYSALASARVDRLAAAGLAEAEWRAVEHDPDIAPEGSPVTGELAELVGRQLAEIDGLLAPDEVLELHQPPILPNTATAVAGFASAAPADASELRRALFQAVWVEGRNLGERAVLAALGIEPPEQAVRAARRWRGEWVAIEGRVVPIVVAGQEIFRGRGALAHLAELLGEPVAPAEAGGAGAGAADAGGAEAGAGAVDAEAGAVDAGAGGAGAGGIEPGTGAATT